MTDITPITLRSLAVVALVARVLVSDVLSVLAAVACVNARLLGRETAPTEEDIGYEAIQLVTGHASIHATAVALAEEALRAVRTFRGATGHELNGNRASRLQYTIEAVAAVERAARTAPEGADASEIVRGSWTGPHYLDGRRTSEIAKLVRLDLAAAHADKGPLRGVSCRVQTHGHMTLKIEIVGVPEVMILNPRRIEAELRRENETAHGWLSQRGYAIQMAIEKIVNAYGRYVSGDYCLHAAIAYASEIKAAQRVEILHALAVRRVSSATTGEG